MSYSSIVMISLTDRELP